MFFMKIKIYFIFNTTPAISFVEETQTVKMFVSMLDGLRTIPCSISPISHICQARSEQHRNAPSPTHNSYRSGSLLLLYEVSWQSIWSMISLTEACFGTLTMVDFWCERSFNTTNCVCGGAAWASRHGRWSSGSPSSSISWCSTKRGRHDGAPIHLKIYLEQDRGVPVSDKIKQKQCRGGFRPSLWMHLCSKSRMIQSIVQVHRKRTSMSAIHYQPTCRCTALHWIRAGVISIFREETSSELLPI